MIQERIFTNAVTLFSVFSKFTKKRNDGVKFKVTVGKRVDEYGIKDYEFIYFLDANVTNPSVYMEYEDNNVPYFSIHGDEGTYFILKENEVNDINVKSMIGDEWSENDKMYTVFLTVETKEQKIDYMIVVIEDDIA